MAVLALASATMAQVAGMDQANETEPNNTFVTADVLTGATGRIKGSLFSGITGSQGTDTDFYSFTAAAGSKVYAIVQNFQANSADAQLAVIAPDGTTVLEFDDDQGSFGGLAPSIAGTTLAAGGTYFLRVTNFSLTNPVSVYSLYFAVQNPATLVAETEPNNNGTAQVMPASGYISGVIDPTADTDTFSFTATAGDTVFLSADLDPERDAAVDANLFIGLGLFGTPANFLVTGDAGTADVIPSEGGAWTVKTTGLYQAIVLVQAGAGGPAATYHLSVTTISPAALGTVTTYTNAVATPLADLALTSSTITIPDSKIIRSLKVVVDITHTNFPDLDAHLRSPSVNDNGLFTDTGALAQTGPQNLSMFDADALPIVFTVLNGVNWQTELAYRLHWFKGENTLGVWTLDIRDDLTANSGTLNSWSLIVEEEPPSTRPIIYNEDFEAGNGSYVSSGTGSEWEHGVPATLAQTVTSPFIAPFLTAASGVNCWKTDLDNTYNNSTINILTSPTIDLAVAGGTGPLTLYWQQRYQIESPSFDRAWVRITDVTDATNTRVVWHNDMGGTGQMSEANGAGASLGNLPESAGWGRYSADITHFTGTLVTVSFNLECDSSVINGGWAVDDVQIRTNDLCPDDPNKTEPGICGCGVADTDTDGDGVADCDDNCVNVGNSGQENSDTDAFGDACDNCISVDNDQANSDTDAFGDACDNCLIVDNDQTNSDTDAFGDACDNCISVDNDQTNSDTDAFGDDCDNCLIVDNDQTNSDTDAFGDACDNCLSVDNDQTNSDTDAFGDDCDNCDLTDNPGQEDGDTDGVGDACDNCPNVSNNNQLDTDSDGFGDACEGLITEICGVAISSVTECPCGPAGGMIGNGCPNSGLPTGALGAHLGHLSGNAILGADDLTVEATNVRQGNGVISFFLAGDDDPRIPFSDGLICSSNNILKLWAWKDPVGPAGTSGGVTTQTGPGATTVPATTSISQRSSDLGFPLSNGQTRVYTMVYRDPSGSQGCAIPSTLNTTNGLRVTWSQL